MSSGAIILPAVNRGTSRTTSQNFSGLFAYASRNDIYFVDIKTIPPTFLDSLYLQNIHRSKVVVISLSKYDGPDILATCCEEGELKIWDVMEKTCLKKIETKETNVLEWVYGSPDTLVFSSDGRFLIKYSVTRNSQIKIRTASEFKISVISTSESNSEYVAAGHCNGVISVINIVQENLVHKLKAHHAEITDISWSRDISDMLLSFSLDLSVRTWKLGENSPQNTYYAPHTKSRNEDKKIQRPLGMFHPTKPDVIICVNPKGEIGEISMKSENSKFAAYLMRNFENNLRFPIALFLSSCKEYLYCWDSFKVTKLNILKKELVTVFPFVMGFVYDLSISRVNPNLLSISNGDGLLRVYDGCSQSNRLNVTSIYIYFKTKIMTAAWHPRSENILAYATDEGRVGIVDTFKKKSLYCFETHHTGAVYSLVWGTCTKAVNAESDELYLYSCGGGTVYVNKENSSKTQALDFDDITEKPIEYHDSNHSYSEICWNFDCTLFCVGSYKGFVELYDASLNFLGRLIVPMKSVESLRWHPATTYMSPAGSPLKSWLACSGSENEIYIFDTAMILSTKPELFMLRPIKKLVGHKKRIVSLSWSEHSDGFLASASKDGSAMVWNVVTQSCIATYLSHFDAVLAVQWSATDKDVIYSGGQEGAVKSWKISEQTPKPAPDKIRLKKKLKKPRKTENKSFTDDTEIESSSLVESKKRSASCEDLNGDSNVQLSVNRINSSKEVTDKVMEVVGSEDVEQKKIKAVSTKKSVLFPAHVFEENAFCDEDIENCKKLAELLKGKKKKTPCFDLSFDSMKKNVLNDDDALKFGIYSDQLTALQMLDVQSGKFLADNNLAAAFDIALFSGNIKQVLQNAAEKKKLNASFVSLAPAVSHSFWLEMCEKFATQLIDSQSYVKAAQYYLICGNIHAAIDLLANKGNIVDAVALAKARLPENDPIIAKLLILLRKKYETSKSIGAVIQCELALNEPLRAAKLLANTLKPQAIRAAAHICQQYELNMQATEYLYLFLETCMVKYNYKAFEACVAEEPFLQAYEALMCVHEELHGQVRYLRNRDGLCLQNGFNNHQDKIWSGVIVKDINQPFINVLHSNLLSRNILSGEKLPLTDILEALKILTERRKSLEVSSEALIPVSIFLTEYILLSQMNKDSAKNDLLNIFQASHNVSSLPRILCLLFFPMNIYWIKKDEGFYCELQSSMSLNTNNNFKSYFLICQSIAEKIQSFKIATQESLFTNKDLHNNISNTALKIKQLLLSKTTDELLLLYFVANLTGELLKNIIKKKELLLNCVSKEALNETKTIVSDTNVIKSANDSHLGYIEQNSLSEMKDSELTSNFNKKVDAELSIDSIVEDNVDKNFSDADYIETLNMDKRNCAKDNDDCLTSDIEKNVTYNENAHCATEPNTVLSLDIQNNLISSECQVSHICEINTVSENDASSSKELNNPENETESHKDDLLCKDVDERLNLDKNDFKDVHELQLQELIQTVIKEADSKAQSIIESNKEASHVVEKDECISEIVHSTDGGDGNYSLNSTESTSNYSTKNDSKIEDMPNDNEKSSCCTIETSLESATSKPVFEQVNEEKQHEPCLTRINLFYSLISLITQIVCKDEFTLLYYLKERLNSLNNIMSATVLSEMSKELVKNNKEKACKNSQKKNKKQQTPSTEKSLASDNICEKKISDLTSITEESCISHNTNENKNVDQTVLTEISFISDNNTEAKTILQNGSAIEEPLPEKETSANDVSSVVSSDSNSNEIQSKEANLFQNDVFMEGGKDKCDEKTMDRTVDMVHANNNHVSSESVLNTKDGSQKKITEILKQEHKVISDALAVLEENAVCCVYPNPLDILSKLSDAIYQVTHKSECHAVRNKLHNFLHNIIIDWQEKFTVGDVKYVCKICKESN